MSAARDILNRLSALGARIECRGERVVLRPGSRTVPPELIKAARRVKAELSKALNAAEDAQSARSEHLRGAAGGNSRVSAASVEDAHLSAFDETEDFCGSAAGPMSKMLNSPQVSIFGGRSERLPRAPEDAPTWGETEEERVDIVGRDGSPAPIAADPTWWRAEYAKRAAHRYPRPDAELLAWREMENRWNLAHGERVPRELCAGCRHPMGQRRCSILSTATASMTERGMIA